MMRAFAKFFLKNRRRQKRVACAIRGTLSFANGLRVAGTVVDLSTGGFRFRLSEPAIFAASQGAVLTLPETRLPCLLRRRRGGHFHCRFRSDLPAHALAAMMGEMPERLRASAAAWK